MLLNRFCAPFQIIIPYELVLFKAAVKIALYNSRMSTSNTCYHAIFLSVLKTVTKDEKSFFYLGGQWQFGDTAPGNHVLSRCQRENGRGQYGPDSCRQERSRPLRADAVAVRSESWHFRERFRTERDPLRRRQRTRPLSGAVARQHRRQTGHRQIGHVSKGDYVIVDGLSSYYILFCR